MFHIKGHGLALRQATEHLARFHFKERPGDQFPHFLTWIGTRVLHAFQHHTSPASHESTLPGPVSPRPCVPAPRGGEVNRIDSIRQHASRTAWLEAQPWVDRDQLAVLGLLDPEGGKPQARYGLAQLAPEETLGAMALQGVNADNLRPITDLAPWESLAAFGLIDSRVIA
jgi:hypothetical protein